MKRIKEWLKRSMNLSMALLLIAILGVGMTMAYFTDIEAAINKITTGQVDITTDENVSDLIKSDIGVTANGKSECYVRMRVNIPTVTYKYPVTDSEGNTTYYDGQAEITLSDGVGNVSILFATDWNNKDFNTIDTLVIRNAGTSEEKEEDAFWKRMEDGFWYLSTTLNPGDKANLIHSITYQGLWVDGDPGQVINPLPDD